MTSTRHLLSALLIAGLAIPFTATNADARHHKKGDGDSEETAGETNGAKSDAPKKEKKPFAEVIEDLEKTEGLFTFWRDPKTEKVLLELAPEQLERDYIYSAKIEQATGERGLYGTIMMDEFVFQWLPLGERIQFVRRNLRFRATEGTPTGKALRNSFTDSILTSAELAAAPHPETGAVLINLADVFLASDLHGIEGFLKDVYETGYKLDKKDSGFVMLKSFPLNSEIGTVAHFKAADRSESGSVTVPDVRSLSLRFRYSLLEIPENDYRPRYADDRVGYFVDQYIDYDDLGPEAPYRRLINRWHLVPKDPDAEISEPVEPIVFWLENTIPAQYRPFFEEGVLLWNAAFEKIGFRNAVQVKQMPDDADWDPADIRYNTIRWFLAYDASFAIGPSHTNPYTGQILDADIGFSDAILRFGARGRFRFKIDPVATIDAMDETKPVFRGQERGASCSYADELVDLASVAFDLMETRGWTSEQEEEFVRQYTVEVAAHEVGHTLGLRHNFRASTIHTVKDLLDIERTRDIGLVSSVMDYNPVVVALEGEPQGDFLPTKVGTYDDWAIEYGYRIFPDATSPDAEVPALRELASRGTDPALAYATDEDAGLGPRSLDPRNTRYDFTSDPLEWFERELKLIAELRENYEKKLLEEGESWNVLRLAYNSSWGTFRRGSRVAAKYVGGLHHNRDHVGDPDGRLPYEPVAAAEQRRALEFLARHIWADDAFELSAETLRKLQFDRSGDFEFSVWTADRLDYPLHTSVLRIQEGALDQLFHPTKLARLQDAPLFQDRNEQFGLADLLGTLRDDIWSELGSGESISSFRRNLQSAHLDRLTKLVVDAPDGVPPDAIALARFDLETLAGRIDARLKKGGDVTERAHLGAAKARIHQALEAPMFRGGSGSAGERPRRHARSY